MYVSSATAVYPAEDRPVLPAEQSRGALLSWMMFVASGIGPFTGQCVHFKHFKHFKHYAPEQVPCVIKR